MVDEKLVLEQTHQIQNLVTRIIAKEILIDERLQVLVLIDKLSLFWSDFQITLKHKREIMTLDDLMVSIQVKEKHQSKHKLLPLTSNLEMQGNANLVTIKKGKKFGNNKFKKHFTPSGRVQKDQKQKTCFVCEKVDFLPNNANFKKVRKMENRATSILFFNKLT